MKINLNMRESPYEVESHKKVLKAIKYAIDNVGKKSFLDIINSNEKQLEKCLKNWIPIYWIEAACKINKQSIWIPVNYQETSFCLNEINIRRKLPSEKIITPKVLFRPVYVESTKDMRELVENAMKKCKEPKRREFSKLVGRTPQSLDNWRAKRAKIPITALMKACQLLKKDIWEVIDGKKLHSSGHKGKEHMVFHNIESPELAEIFAWIKTDGHLFINKTSLYFVQNKEGIDCVEDIAKKLCKIFEIPDSKIILKKKEGKPNAKSLYLWSAPLRQILHLRYKIPLGFKSTIIDYSTEIGYCKTREDKLRLISAIFQSEGCFNYNRSRPNFFVTSSSKKASKDIYKLLKLLGYKSCLRYSGAFRVGVDSIESSIKLCYDILPYFKHNSKVQDILFSKNKDSGISKLNYLERIRIKNKNTKDLFEKVKRKLNIGSFKLFEYLNKNFNISEHSAPNWLYGSRGVPVYVIEKLCKTTNENILNFVPPYISFLLFVHGHIDYAALKETRGMDYDLVKQVLSCGK